MKSPFWTYFHDKLNWLPIFRPGPVSALMRGLALHMDEVRQDILWLREQWNPATCEMWLLERYGASRGIFRTRFDTDESYRKRVIYAYAWHKLGGRARGVEQIYRENGLAARITPSLLKGLWAHFRVHIDVSGYSFGPADAEMSFWIANEYKPARSVLEGIWTQTEHPMQRHIGAIARSDTSARTCLYFAPKKAPACVIYTGAGISGQIFERYTLIQLPAKVTPIAKNLGALATGATSARLRFWQKKPAPVRQPDFHGMAVSAWTKSAICAWRPKAQGRIAAGFAITAWTRILLNPYRRQKDA